MSLNHQNRGRATRGSSHGLRNEIAARPRECTKWLHKDVQLSRGFVSDCVEMPHYREKHNSNEGRSRATSVKCTSRCATRGLFREVDENCLLADVSVGIKYAMKRIE